MPELLRLLGDTRKSGSLLCSSARASKRIQLVDGVIVAAESTDPNVMLGHFLIHRGLVSEDQVRQALQIQERSKVFSGEALVRLGAIDEATLEVALREKAEEAVYGLFDWRSGSFHFQPGSPPSEPSRIPLQLRMEDVLWKGVARQEELERIREVFPQPELVPKLIREPAASLLGDPLASKVAELVDGRRSVAQIQLSAHGSEYAVGRHLFDLFSNGCLVVMGPDRAAEAEQDRAALAPPAVEKGDELFRSGHYEEALQIYRRAAAAGVERPDLQRLTQATESLVLEQIYHRVLPPNGVLRQLERSRAAEFSPREFFLLDQINGRWTVKELVRLSPLREVDAVLVLRDLLQRGAIEVVEGRA